jgi:hypothetical protein
MRGGCEKGVSAWRVWTELKAPGAKLLNFRANAASMCQFLIGQDQICPDGASLGTKKFVLLDVGLKRPYGASCGTKTVFRCASMRFDVTRRLASLPMMFMHVLPVDPFHHQVLRDLDRTDHRSQFSFCEGAIGSMRRV